jgi:hypothetical protein
MHRWHSWRKLGYSWKNRAIFGETGLFLEIGAEGDRAPAGTWCSRGRVCGPPRRRFRACFAISRFAGSPSRTDPARKQEGQINHHDGGRGVYFEDLNGHLLEVITRPYGSGGWNP